MTRIGPKGAPEFPKGQSNGPTPSDTLLNSKQKVEDVVSKVYVNQQGRASFTASEGPVGSTFNLPWNQ